MKKKNQRYYEELYRTTEDMLYRMKRYEHSADTGMELARLKRELAKLKLEKAQPGRCEEALRMLERMRVKLLTMMENVLYTV